MTTISSSSRGRCARPRLPHDRSRASRGPRSCRRWRATAWSSGSGWPGSAIAGSPAPPARSPDSTSRASAPPTPTSTPATRPSWRPTAWAAWPWPPRPPSSGSSARGRSTTPWPPPGAWPRSAPARTRSSRSRRWAARARPRGSTSGRSRGPGSCPPINTAIVHRAAPRMIGAGIATPPVDPFLAALVAFGERYPR